MDTRTAEQLRRDIARLERRLAHLESMDRPETDLAAINAKLDALQHFVDGEYHNWNAYPAAPNADDDEFLSDLVGSFWTWSASPASYDIDSSMPSHLYVRCNKADAADANIRHTLAAAIDFNTTTWFGISVPCMGLQSATSDEWLALGLLDVSSGYYAEVELRNSAAATPLVVVRGWYQTSGARTQIGGTVTLGYTNDPLWLFVRCTDNANHRAAPGWSLCGPNSGLASVFGFQNMGSTWDPDVLYMTFGKCDDAGLNNNRYFVDFVRRV